MTSIDLRKAAREIFDSALRAVDARKAIHSVVSINDQLLTVSDRQFRITNREIYAVAIGKAAHGMAEGLTEILGDRIKAGVISGPLGTNKNSNIWQVFNGGHPVPNDQSIAAARAARLCMQRANEQRAIVVFLISGGGSAMLEWPRNDNITLDDLRRANSVLVSSAATIKEINTVRRAFSTIKGGGLAAQAPDATQINLIISDVNSGDEENVASGPTLASRTGDIDLKEIVRRYDFQSSLPRSVVDAIENFSASSVPHLDQATFVILSNQTALNAAAEKAKALGFRAVVAIEILEQSIDVGCELLLDELGQLEKQHKNEILCLISGGEFSCPVRGSGQGGRNLETVLRCALKLDERGIEKPTVVLSAGTDGLDGNSPAAGAIADQDSIARARKQAIEGEEFLADSDSFSFFNKLDDAIITGSTGTNVRDLRILLRG